MSGLTFNERALENQLSGLNSKSLVVFGLLCCERIFPNYVAFVEQHKRGNADTLRYTLDVCWEFVVNKRIISDFDGLKKACKEVAPDTEDFDSLSVSAALDAAISIATLVKLIESSKVEHAVTIATYARDTVDMYVQELENMQPNTGNLEEQIRNHQLMQRELGCQQSDFELLLGDFDIEILCRQFRDSSPSNIYT